MSDKDCLIFEGSPCITYSVWFYCCILSYLFVILWNFELIKIPVDFVEYEKICLSDKVILRAADILVILCVEMNWLERRYFECENIKPVHYGMVEGPPVLNANLCIDRYFCLFMSIINIKNLFRQCYCVQLGQVKNTQKAVVWTYWNKTCILSVAGFYILNERSC